MGFASRAMNENEVALRGHMKCLLDKCTEGQRAKFALLYGPVDDILFELLDDAFALLERTLSRTEDRPSTP